MAVDFAGTSKILSDPASADPSAAVANIDAWKASLTDLGSAGQSIVADLDELKAALTSSSPDGAKIRGLLGRLGQATTQNASGNAQLQDLGRQLSALGG